MLHQQVQRKKEKMARLADLQRQIDEASKEVRHLAQDEQNRRPQHRELHQEGFFNEDDWYEDFHHGNFAFDDASPLSAELQATPWPPSYKPPQLPMYDGHSDPKQFLQGLWRLPGKILSCGSWPKSLDHGLNDNFIGHRWCLCPQTQEPSNIRLKVFLVILRALEQSLSSNRLRLEPLETSDQHVLQLLP